MKKILLASLILSILLVACGGADEAGETAEREGPLRIALVAPSATNDLAFTQSMYDALVKIQQERGEENFEIAVSEGMFVVDDAAAAIRDYATEGYNLIIAHGSQYGSSLVEIAPDFPDTSFAWGTTRDTFADQGITNVYAYTGNTNEGGYITGVVTALLTQSGTVGLIGPIEVGDAKLSMDGFVKGVTVTNPDINILTAWTGSFSDVALAAEAAQTQIDAGADMLTGTAQMVVGAIGVAKDEGVLWAGHQTSQASLAPEHVVVTQVYDWTVILEPMLANIDEGTLGGEIYELTLANGGLVVEFNDGYDTPDDVKQAAEDAVAGIIDGSVDASVEDTVAPSESTDSGELFRIAAVLPGTSNDFGISQGVYEALIAYQEEMGEENVEVAFSESMFVVDDAATAIRDYASEGFDMVIAASSAFGSSVEEIAPDFPDTSFVWGTNPETFGQDNIYAFSVMSDQGAYVGGVMAGMLADKIAFVGPIYVGSIASSFDGFKAGVLSANPDAEVLENFTGSFSDVALASEASRTMVDAGVTVLASQTEMGTGVAGVAEQEDGVVFFGNDADFAPFAPEATYASQAFRYGVAFRQMIDQIKDGQLGGEVVWLTLENGGIEVVSNPDFDFPDGVQAAAEETIQGILDGSIDTSPE